MIFHSYVSLPEGKLYGYECQKPVAKKHTYLLVVFIAVHPLFNNYGIIGLDTSSPYPKYICFKGKINEHNAQKRGSWD